MQNLNQGSLQALAALSAEIETELGQLPTSDATGLTDAQRAIHALQSEVDTFWKAADEEGESRRQRIARRLEQATRLELAYRMERGDVHPEYARCFPEDLTTSDVVTSKVALCMNEKVVVPLHGAMLFERGDTHAALTLPGIGICAAPTRKLLLERLTAEFNDPWLRLSLMRLMPLEHQHLLHAIEDEDDLVMPAFDIADWQIRPTSATPFDEVLFDHIERQRADIAYSIGAGAAGRSAMDWKNCIDQAVRPSSLTGTSAIVANLRDERARRDEGEPGWLRYAEPEQRATTLLALQRYEGARNACLSVLGDAASIQRFAALRLRARIANDLGYDLAPEAVQIIGRRTLPFLDEPYEFRCSLVELALHGLHPGDELPGSAFTTDTVLTIDGKTSGHDYAELTPAYLAGIIQALELRIAFGPVQATAHKRVSVRDAMRRTLLEQLRAHAWMARLRGEIRVADQELIEALAHDPATTTDRVEVALLRLAGGTPLDGILLIRRRDDAGQVERILMCCPDAPRQQTLQGFDDERRLTEELVSWTVKPELSAYLVGSAATADQAQLKIVLEELALKPEPATDFVTLDVQPGLTEALDALVSGLVAALQDTQREHTPNWYLASDDSQRRRLVELENGLQSAQSIYTRAPHTHVVEFERYVWERASDKINALLETPARSVDPDRILIHTPRETLTYTRMVRDGYDDSLGLLNPAADTTATFEGPAKVDLSLLTPQKVARSVHGAWLSDGYTRLIETTLLDPGNQGYEWRRRHALAILQMQMAQCALTSLMQGTLDAKQHRWLKASIESFQDTDTDVRQCHRVYPLQLHLENSLIASAPGLGDALNELFDIVSGANPFPVARMVQVETIQGCLILVPSEGNSAEALIYTPNAPDGLGYRPLRQFTASLGNPGMSDYYKDRCSRKANRVLAFFMADLRKGGKSRPPALPEAHHTDLREVCYDRPLRRKIRDVQAFHAGRSELLSKLAWTTVELFAVTATLPFPPAAFAVGAALAMRESFQASKSFAEGDDATASMHILFAMLNSLGAGADLMYGMKGVGGALRGLRRGSIDARKAVHTARRQQRNLARQQAQVIDLQGETFIAGNRDANHLAPLLRQSEKGELVDTGVYARQHVDGPWHALDATSPNGHPAYGNSPNPAYAVDISLEGGMTVSEAHAAGITFVGGKPHVQLDGKVFQVQYEAAVRRWHIVDPNSPFAFFGRQPIRRAEDGSWHVVPAGGLRGGAPGKYKPLRETAGSADASDTAVSAYELPHVYQRFMYGIITPQDDLLDADLLIGTLFDPYFKSGRELRATLRGHLHRDASAWQPITAPRPQLPNMTPDASFDDLLKGVFEKSKGLVISETPNSVSSKRLLIENMQALAERDVKVLYIEHALTDMHSAKLKKYYSLGQRSKAGSHELKHFLDFVHDGALKGRADKLDYYHLIKTAHRHGIEVRPLSTLVSYEFPLEPLAAAADDALATRRMSTFIADRIIAADIVHDSQRHWVALLDERLATAADGLPGIAELQGAISVRVKDVAQDAVTRITSSSEEGATAAGRADFMLEFANPDLKPSAPAPTAANANSQVDGALAHLMTRRPLIRWDFDPITGYPVFHGSKEHLAAPSTLGFKRNASGRWERAVLDDWPADDVMNATQQSLRDIHYEVPAAHVPPLHQLINFERAGLDSRYFFYDLGLSETRDLFFGLRRRLIEDARAVLQAELPPRPVIPELPADIPQTALLDALYEHGKGFVIGEKHAGIASKRLLIDNMEHLAASDVKTLYLEHMLTDVHQLDLDRFAESGIMSRRLLHDLRRLDHGHRTDPTGVYTFENLVVNARRHGIEVRAIDCAAAYHLKGAVDMGKTLRQEVFSFFASRTIRRHQAAFGEHKWVALVGDSHTNLFRDKVPGLAELEGVLGLRVTDVPPGGARGVIADVGELYHLGLSPDWVKVSGDLLMEVEASASTRLPRVFLPGRLTRPGQFILDRSDPAKLGICHRARNGIAHQTPIQTNAQGRLFVERPSWTTVHGRDFATVDELVQALKDFNMVQVI